MRNIFFIWVCVISVRVFATSNLNQVSCSYTFENENWELDYAASFWDSYDLANGQAQYVGASYTQGEVNEIQYGICTMLVGTNYDDQVEVINYIYEGRRIGEFSEEDCMAFGDSVTLVRTDHKILSRGQHLNSIWHWSLKNQPEYMLNIYIPTLEELTDLGDHQSKICEDLIKK